MPAISQHGPASSWMAEVGWQHVGQRKAEVSSPGHAFQLAGCRFVPTPRSLKRKKSFRAETRAACCPGCAVHVLFTKTPLHRAKPRQQGLTLTGAWLPSVDTPGCTPENEGHEATQL